MNGPKLTLAALLALSVAGAARRGSAARDTSGSWALFRVPPSRLKRDRVLLTQYPPMRYSEALSTGNRHRHLNNYVMVGVVRLSPLEPEEYMATEEYAEEFRPDYYRRGSLSLKRDDAWQRRVTEEVHAHWSRRGIDGWTPELDPSDGSLSWSHPEADVIVYATPFFGDPGADGFGVLLVSEDGLGVYDSLDVDLPYGPGYAESYGRVMRPILDNVMRGARFG
jgi:hypothetical protein